MQQCCFRRGWKTTVNLVRTSSTHIFSFALVRTITPVAQHCFTIWPLRFRICKISFQKNLSAKEHSAPVCTKGNYYFVYLSRCSRFCGLNEAYKFGLLSSRLNLTLTQVSKKHFLLNYTTQPQAQHEILLLVVLS